MKHIWVMVAVAALVATDLGAQAVPNAGAPDAALARARALVADGNVAGARAVLDSALATTPDGAPAKASLLYARAGSADSPVEAERDWLRVAVEYASAPEAAEATLRLAQLELQRGDNAQAVRRLERLRAEQPAGSVRGRASYWLARGYLEGGDAARGCAALGEARSEVGDTDVEIRNQVAYYAPRCRDVAARADTTPTAPVASAPVPVPTPARVTPAPAATTHVAPTHTTTTQAATKRTAASRAAAAERTTYTVQVAALQQRATAQAMARKLAASGYSARVDGGSAPYRVRIGRYPTRAAAETVAKRLRARKTPALVVEAAPR